MVFQCLSHTTTIDKVQARLFAFGHERRNLAEYEGYMDVDDQLLAELLEATDTLLKLVRQAM